MFDIGASELLLVVVVAIVVIGPKDMPLAMRTAGRWLGKARRVSAYFRSGVETMIREAEMADMEKQWKEQNQRIIAEHPEEGEAGAPAAPPSAGAESRTGADPAQPLTRSDHEG